ncbi:TlpA family protein disulfide reductase [Micrococcales bacterium 31B]|nr:TlpA family protein disulfide reductase [Micrococcales bacterium 31B]
MTGSAPGRSRRGVLRTLAGAGLVVPIAGLVAACGGNSDLSAQYNAGDNKGYVAGDGSVLVFAVAERGAPIELKATAFDGSAVDFAAWRGQVVVMNMWYATCPPCRREAPDLVSVATEFMPKGVRFIGLNTRDGAGEASAFEKKFGIPYPSMPDTQGQVTNALGEQHRNGLIATPTTWVLDAEGRLAAIFSGAAEGSTLKGVVEDVAAGKNV